MFNFSRVLSLLSLLQSGTASLPPAQYHEKQASRRHTLPHQRSHLPQEMQPYTKSRWRARRFRCRVRPVRSAGSNPQRFSRPSAVSQSTPWSQRWASEFFSLHPPVFLSAPALLPGTGNVHSFPRFNVQPEDAVLLLSADTVPDACPVSHRSVLPGFL